MSEQWGFSGTKLNIAGFRELRKSPAAQEWVASTGRRIASAASAAFGLPYVFEMSPGRNRARGVVFPDSADAARDSLRNLTLLRAMGAGRR